MREKWIVFQSVPVMQYQRPKPPADPFVNSMYRIDREMQNILNREDLDEEQKLSLYDAKLRTYLDRYEKYRHPTLPTMQSSNDEVTTTSPDTSHILETIPKQVQPQSRLFLHRLKDVMSWNEKGEIYLKGDSPIQGSNIIDLLGTAVRPHSLKSVSSSPLGMHTFIRGMREANIPHSWIRNKTVINRMQSTDEPDELSNEPKSGGFGTPSQPKTGGFGTPRRTGGFGTPLQPKTGGFGTPRRTGNFDKKKRNEDGIFDGWEEY